MMLFLRQLVQFCTLRVGWSLVVVCVSSLLLAGCDSSNTPLEVRLLGGEEVSGGDFNTFRAEARIFKIVIAGVAVDSADFGDSAGGVTSIINVQVPVGTPVSQITPSIELAPGATYTPQGPQDFTQPVTFTITSADKSVTKSYIISVDGHSNDKTSVKSFSFSYRGQQYSGVVNNVHKTIKANMGVFLKSGESLDVSGAKITFTSSTTQSDFDAGATITVPALGYHATIRVTAADGAATDYELSIHPALMGMNHDTGVTGFSFIYGGQQRSGVIDNANKTIKVNIGASVAPGASLTISEATIAFESSTTRSDFVAGSTINVPENGYDKTVQVTAEDGSIVSYQLSIHPKLEGLSSDTNVKGFSFTYGGKSRVGVIDNVNKTIKVDLDASLKPGESLDISGVSLIFSSSATRSDFVAGTSINIPAAGYDTTVKVTAEDGTVVDYQLSIHPKMLNLSSDTSVKSFSFTYNSISYTGVIDNASKTIKAQVGVSLKLGETIGINGMNLELSSKEAQSDFNAGFNITVPASGYNSTIQITAEDGTVVDYQLSIHPTLGSLSSDTSVNSFSFNYKSQQYIGVIDNTNKTIKTTMDEFIHRIQSININNLTLSLAQGAHTDFTFQPTETISSQGYSASITVIAENGATADYQLTIIPTRIPFYSDTPIGNNTSGKAISNAVDLENIANDMSGTYHLAADIDLTGINWQPLGNQADGFTGKLYGNGYAIYNLSIDQDASYVGLFSTMQSAIVNNLFIGIESIKGFSYMGALAGFVINGVYENIAIAPMVRDSSVDHIISDQLSATGTLGAYVGGVMGLLLENNNTGTTAMDAHNYDVNLKVINSLTSQNDRNVGGLVGALLDHKLVGSNSGIIRSGASTSVGGLAGLSQGEVIGTNSGMIVATGNASQIGGLIGVSENAGSATLGTNSGNISAGLGESIGGLIGMSKNGSSVAGINSGEISSLAAHFMGGLVGDNHGVVSGINLGNVHSNKGNNIGGLVGRTTGDNAAPQGDVSGYSLGWVYSLNENTVTSSNNDFGSLVGAVNANNRTPTINAYTGRDVAGDGDKVGNTDGVGRANHLNGTGEANDSSKYITNVSNASSAQMPSLIEGTLEGQWIFSPGLWPEINLPTRAVGILTVLREQPAQPASYID